MNDRSPETGKLRGITKLEEAIEGHAVRVVTIAFSPDGQTLVSGSEAQTIEPWNVLTNVLTKECLRTLQGYSYAVLSVAFSPDGQTLASGSQDGTIKLWDVKTGKCLKTLKPLASKNASASKALEV